MKGLELVMREPGLNHRRHIGRRRIHPRDPSFDARSKLIAEWGWYEARLFDGGVFGTDEHEAVSKPTGVAVLARSPVHEQVLQVPDEAGRQRTLGDPRERL